jgi:ABC-type multidrug transport system ATPase subunit
VIRVQNLHKRYGDHAALSGVDLAVEPGEIFGFVGPNGAGKSTFMKCVLGIVRPDSGSFQVGQMCSEAGQDPVEIRKLVGYSPGETSLYQGMRSVDFLDFALACYPHADPDRGRELLDLFGLPAHARIKSFSHGMKRKVLLAQALASGAPLLMLDEPMEGLDPEARHVLEGLLLEAAAAQRSVFFSSHDLASVERVCDRVAFLRQGKILEIGRIEDILQRAGHMLRLSFREAVEKSQLPTGAGLEWQGANKRWRLKFEGRLEDILPLLQNLPIAGMRDGTGRLEDVFETLYGPAPEDS